MKPIPVRPVLVAILAAGAIAEAQTVARQDPPARAGLAAFARQQGFSTCTAELDELERKLFAGSEFTLRPFLAEKDPSRRPFSAMVDSRREVGGRYQRALTHVAAAPLSGSSGCTVSYEQTQYHEARCDEVLKQMAPTAQPSPAPAQGALTVDLHRNMSLTLMPVGKAQCVSVLKEVSYR